MKGESVEVESVAEGAAAEIVFVLGDSENPETGLLLVAKPLRTADLQRESIAAAAETVRILQKNYFPVQQNQSAVLCSKTSNANELAESLRGPARYSPHLLFVLPSFCY